MPYIDYNRYAQLKNDDGSYNIMPFVKLPVNETDKYEYWSANTSRLDKLSFKYYGNPFYDFLILYANSQYVSEFDIPDGEIIRIPFPLSLAISQYESIVSINK